MAWVPPPNDVKKFLEQLFKWLVGKKNTKTGKTVTLISLGGPHSYMTNIIDIRSGMKIQQVCLGRFSCMHHKAHKRPPVLTDADCVMTGKLGAIKYIHRLCGLDDVLLDSSRAGLGGRYSGDSTTWHQSGDAAYGIMRFWFDSWMATGTWAFCRVVLQRRK